MPLRFKILNDKAHVYALIKSVLPILRKNKSRVFHKTPEAQQAISVILKHSAAYYLISFYLIFTLFLLLSKVRSMPFLLRPNGTS